MGAALTRDATASRPAVLVAAPASGQGKTSTVAALARLHARRGRRVRVSKCGPGFLDPHGLERLPVLAVIDASAMAGTRHAAAGRPVRAECAGMMALFEQLAAAEGTVHPMWGLLPGRTTMQPRLAALGPQQLATGGDVLRGPTFHHSACDTPLAPAGPTRHPVRPAAGEALSVRGPVRASYSHAWFASSPAATARLSMPGALG